VAFDPDAKKTGAPVPPSQLCHHGCASARGKALIASALSVKGVSWENGVQLVAEHSKPEVRTRILIVSPFIDAFAKNTAGPG
jgi:F0F1-type ATP synthase membrane subunit c/vacuolar-type H+-ATPase subunit K